MNAYALWHRKSTTVLHEGSWWYYDSYGNDGTEIEVLGIVDGEIPSELKIPETLDGMKVASIGDYAFASCDEIKTLELNTNLTHMGWASFTCCRNLEAVKIPGTLSRLGDFAFSSCDSLWNVEIGHGVKELGQGCLQYLPQLTFVTIPSSVTNVEWYAMSQDTYLFEVTFRGRPPTINGRDGATIQYSAEGMFEGSEFVSVKVLNDNGWKDANGERLAQWSFRDVFYEPSLPEYSEVLTDRDVCDILAGTSFESHITKGEEYNRFREWVDYAIGEYAIDDMHQILKANPYAWLSYALYLDRPLTALPTANQFKITSFCKSADAGKFEIELAIYGVPIDERAIQLSEVFVVEGCDKVNGTYSADKVNAAYATPLDGRVKVTVSPADPSADSFFLRAVIRP